MAAYIGSRGRRSGFSLIELLIAVAILSILLVIGLPSMFEFIASNRLKGAADALTSQMAIARSEAMRLDRNTSVNVVGADETWCAGGRQFVPGAGTVGLVSAAGNAPTCDCSSTPSECTIAGNTSVVTSADYSGIEITAGTGSLQFDRKVGVLDPLATTTISLRHADYPTRFALNIVVGPLGHARVCTPSGAAVFGGFSAC